MVCLLAHNAFTQQFLWSLLRACRTCNISQTAAHFVHSGPWINWSHGIVPGSTITLSEPNGELLTAFLAVFVTAAGASC